MRGLKDKVVVLTGGLGDIGYACARRLAEEGCRVTIFDLPSDDSGRASAIGCRYQRADISNEAQVAEACHAVGAAVGPIAVLVNCAACFIFKGVEAEVAEWEQILRVNVIGTSLMAKYAVPQMKEQGTGSII